MTPIRHITVDALGRIFEVTHMFDRASKPTLNPAEASTCVILVGDTPVDADADDVPIYTVH